MKIALPLTLPCGVELKNRLAKSAMSENMSSPDKRPNRSFENVYRRWALGGAGLNISGNVMVDSRALGEAHNVVVENGFEGMEDLKKWAQAGTQNGAQLWMQINHPGKQIPKFLNKTPSAPSAIGFQAPLNRLFNPPRALTEAEIWDIIERFSWTAKAAQLAGFTGVQIHGAHGYLVSQFLSPLHNQRNDSWGGSLENRMRFVCEIYRAIRAEVGRAFPVSIKLNSSDFKKGGFSEEESMGVVQVLDNLGMDLIEISGGTYEAPEMTGVTRKPSTIDREAYFTEYSRRIRALVQVPLMLTGGFRSLAGMEAALASNSCDVIGLGRSMVLNPEFPQDLLSGKDSESLVKPLTTGIKTLDRLFPLEITWYTHQIQRMGKNKNPNPKASVLGTVIKTIASTGLQSLKQVRA